MSRKHSEAIWAFLNSALFTSVLFGTLLSIGGYVVKSKTDAAAQARQRRERAAAANVEIEWRASRLFRAAAQISADADNPVTSDTLRDILRGAPGAYTLSRYRDETLEGVVAAAAENSDNGQEELYRALGACAELNYWLSYPKRGKDLADNQRDIQAVTWMGFSPWLGRLGDQEKKDSQASAEGWQKDHPDRQARILRYRPTVLIASAHGS